MYDSRITKLTASNAIPIPRWRRLDGVDLLRGLAIFLVLMNHINMRLFLAKIPYAAGLPEQLVHALVWNGQYGVQIFFAVSGFLITSTSLRRWEPLSTIRIGAFYALRFARIAPLFLLLLTVLSVLHAAGFKDFVVAAQTGGLGRALAAALTFHINVLESRRGYLPGNWDVLWSLSVEETFYLLFPLLCWGLGRGKGLVALLAVGVILGPFARTVLSRGNGVWQEYSYLGGADAIALGCLTALALHKGSMFKVPAWWIGGAGIAVLACILSFHSQVDAIGLVDSGLDMTFCAVGTCMVIMAAARTRWTHPRLLTPVAMIGHDSYEVYLTHMFVVFALFDLFVRLGSPLRGVPALFIGVIVVSGAFGKLVAHGYSEPMNRYLRKRWGAFPGEEAR